MNCLIDKTGKTIDCTAVKHDIICRQQLKTTLAKFLSSGGCRVMVRHDTMAVEFYRPLTDKQNRVVNKLLKKQPIYCVVCAFKTIEKLRPIRSFVFDDGLLPKKDFKGLKRKQ